MADAALSSKSAASALGGTELIYVVQGGTTKYATPAQILTYVLTGCQPLDADLTAISALTTTSYGRAFLTLANDAAFKAAILTALGLTGFTVGGSSITLTAAGGSNEIPIG